MVDATETDAVELVEAIQDYARMDYPADLRGQQRYFSHTLSAAAERAKQALYQVFGGRELTAVAELCAEIVDGEFKTAAQLDEEGYED